MRRLLGLSILILIAGSGTAMAQVSGTVHNLSSYDGVDAEICVFCHTPHNATVAVPLWNHEVTGETFTVYTSATMASTAGTIEGSGSISELCLSCHDGTTAINSIINDPGAVDVSTGGLDTIGAVPGNLGTDLSNDHPVNIPMLFNSNDLQPQATAESAGLVFFAGDTVQCASCHDVHDNTNAPFLVAANTGSALCIGCHTN